MPSGKVHASVSVLSAGYLAAGSAVAIIYFSAPPFVAASTLGCLAGVLLGPDLDVDDGNISHYLIRKHLGHGASWLWKVYWWPYAKLIPHRSLVSHIPVLSTALRVVYIAWGLVFIWPASWDLSWALWIVLGLVLSDFHHWFMDVVDGAW